MARAGRGQPPRPRTAAIASPGGGGGNYFAGVLDELRKVVWPTWDELGRMTGVVITTVVLMAIIVSAADYGLGLVVRQLYTVSSSSSPNGSTVKAQPSVKASPGTTRPSAAATAFPSTPSGTTPAPVTP